MYRKYTLISKFIEVNRLLFRESNINCITYVIKLRKLEVIFLAFDRFKRTSEETATGYTSIAKPKHIIVFLLLAEMTVCTFFHLINFAVRSSVRTSRIVL